MRRYVLGNVQSEDMFINNKKESVIPILLYIPICEARKYLYLSDNIPLPESLPPSISITYPSGNSSFEMMIVVVG